MQVCKCCNTDQPEENYSLYTSKTGKKFKMRHCKECQRQKVQLYRKSNPTAYNLQASERHLNAKIKAIEYKGGKCFDCGGIFPPYVYDFHHLDPTHKDITPSGALRRRFDTAKLELDKCVLLCANCHRIRHWSDT